MKNLLIISCITIGLLLTGKSFSQGFIAEVGENGFAPLYGNDCILKLESGEEIRGKFAWGTGSVNGLTKITVKLENGEKAKFVPEEVVSLHIKASGLLKLVMVSESGSSLKEISNTDFKEIVNRDYIIFESELTAKKKNSYRLLQLLNRCRK